MEEGVGGGWEECKRRSAGGGGGGGGGGGVGGERGRDPGRVGGMERVCEIVSHTFTHPNSTLVYCTCHIYYMFQK